MKNYVLLAGGGKVGYHLAATLRKNGWQVGLVEADPVRASKIARDLGITVIGGDATDLEILSDADAGEARYVVALTGSDEANLAVCQMAKTAFGVQETIARVINPKNEGLFRLLGVDETISTTSVAAETIEKVLPAKGMRLSPIFSSGDVEMAEVEIHEASRAHGKTVADLDLPADSLLIAVTRAGAVLFPRGKTAFEAGDRVFALVRRKDADALQAALNGRKK
jgi:trk system potassium uptake protein TrkA